MTNENCIFCKIISGDIPSFKIYEDEKFFAFLTIKAHTKGHTLLIPKAHHEEILDLGEELTNKYFSLAKTIAEKIKSTFNPVRVAYLVAGLEVNHTHLHLFPINKTDDLNPELTYNVGKEELTEVQKLLTF